jgi:HEAT repeat protein
MSKPDFEAELGELDLVELESVKRLIQLLANSIKSLLIYPKNNPLPKEFKRKLYLSLIEFLDAHDELNLAIEPSQILFEGKVVHADGEREEGVAYILHKDGVRELAFLKGLEQGEIDDFTEVMETCSKFKDLEEDLVTMLWEKDFNHIKYLVVDDLLDVDVPSAEDIPDKWDFNKLFYSEIELGEQKTASDMEDSSDLASRVREEETKELLKKLKDFSSEEIENIQRLLEMDDRQRSLDEFMDILTEILIVEPDFSEFSQMVDTTEKILDALITVADFPSATRLVKWLKRIEEITQKLPEEKAPSKKKRVEKAGQVVDGAGEEEKIKRITQILNEKENVDFSLVKEYLFSLNWNALPPVLHMLRDLKDFSARKMVCEVLIEKGRDHTEFLREGISDQRWYVVRNVVSVLGAIGSMEGLKLLKQCIHHPDLRVRKEIIVSLIKIPGPAAGALLVPFLTDEDKGIRLLACRGLARRKEKGALPSLMTILKDEQFKDESPEEKKGMLECLASIGGSEAIHYLVKMVSKRSWLRRDKHNETRIFAIGALSLIETPEAKEALLQLSKKRNKVVRQACQNALRRLEYRRMRDAEPDKPHDF